MADTGRCWGSWTMPRTVPKTVARAAPANGKNKSTNHKTLRMRTLLLKWMNRAAAKPRRGLISKRDGEGGASDGRGNDARRRRKRFDRTKKIHGPRQFDGRTDRCRWRGCYGGGQHESDRSEKGAFGIVTARHGASHHPGHF